MKKALSLLGIGVLLSAGVASTSSDNEAYAASLGTVVVDCTDSALDLSALLADFVGYVVAQDNIVVPFAASDTITIENESTTGTCTVADPDSIITNEGTIPVKSGANNGSWTLTLDKSGFFTIKGAGGSDPALRIDTDSCSTMSGSGIADDPWRVTDIDDFRLIGTDECHFAGHYLQTDDIRTVTSPTDAVSGADFTGVYDGDHYSISLNVGGEDAHTNWQGLFVTLGAGSEIRKLRLTGSIYTNEGTAGILSQTIRGGVISEVDIRASLLSNQGAAIMGGFAAATSEEDEGDFGGARIQYSRFAGTLGWSAGSATRASIGGFLGAARDSNDSTGALEIRDSYSLGAIVIDSTNLTPTVSNQFAHVFAGGFVGSLGRPRETDGLFTGTNQAANLTIVRSYAAGTITNECINNNTDLCFLSSSGVPRVFHGGMLGLSGGLALRNSDWEDGLVSNQNDTSNLTIVSSFWLERQGATSAVGLSPTASAPVDYESANPFEPVAVALSAAEMRTLTSYTTGEDEENAGNPGGATLPISSDYRWAITTERSTFVPSTYTSDSNADPGTESDLSDYTNRDVYAPLDDGAREYLRLRGGVLDAYGGDDPRSTTTYTELGNVWEICSSERFPTLVWEERTCGDGGGGSSTSSRDRADDELSPAEAAAALGLTEAEYAAFLASGLTLEQFLASRLAATGPSSALVSLSAYSVIVLFAMGGILLWWSRRSANAR